MKDYLQMWLDDLASQRTEGVKRTFEVTGEKSGPGAEWRFGRIHLRVEPAPAFEIVNSVDSNDKVIPDYIDWAVLGLLDVLMITSSYPLVNLRIYVLSIEHTIESSEWAFRMAGRDAANQILEKHKVMLKER